MRLVCLSDTHGEIIDNVPDGDILIFAGDFSARGDTRDVLDFKGWLYNQPHKYKVIISGNHDLYMEKYNHIGRLLLNSEDTFYLENSEITLNGLRIWGSPHTPEFMSWAFMKKRGDDIAQVWKQIPEGIDILITHGLPYGILDKNARHEHCGCYDLLQAVKRIKPKVHIGGHIHEAYGIEEIDGTKFVNCSLLNEVYARVNDPIVVEV